MVLGTQGGSWSTGSKNEKEGGPSYGPWWLPLPLRLWLGPVAGPESLGATALSSPRSLVHFPLQWVFLAGYKQLLKAPMPH